MTVVHLDRHILASNPSTIDRGMRSFGWTQALAGARGDAVFRRAPWGEPPNAGDDVASWTGLKARGTDGTLGRMESAFLSLDERLAFSVWGAFGAQPRRTLTHTILFDEDTFFAVAGNPFVLYDDAAAAWLGDLTGGAAFVEPGAIEPIALTLSPAFRNRANAARFEHAFRLRARLLETYSTDDLETVLAAIYERLGAREPVALVAGDGDHRAIIRLAWLSLPIEERLTRSFCTEQTKAGPPIADLVAVADAGRGAGAGRQLVSDLVVHGRSAGAGRRYWASIVVRADARPWTSAEADLRSFTKSFGIVNGDTITPYVMFRQLQQEATARGPAGPRAEQLCARLVQNPEHGLTADRLGELVAALMTGDDAPRPGTARQVWNAVNATAGSNTSGAIATAVDLLAQGDGVAQLHALLLACAQAMDETSPALERVERTSGKMLLANPVAIVSFMRAIGARATAGEHALAHRALDDLPKEVVEQIDIGDLVRSGAVDLRKDGGGRWAATLISTLLGVGIDCWPVVHPWILAAGAAAHTSVRDVLARTDFLDRALRDGWAPRGADYFAIAAPDPTRLLTVLRTCYGEPHDETSVRQGIAYLANSARFPSALGSLANDEDPARTLALLTDPAWSAGVGRPPELATARGDAISAALAKLAHQAALQSFSDGALATSLESLSPVQARKLGEVLVRALERRSRSANDHRRLLWSTVPFALADMDTAATTLIERILTLFPARDYTDAWLTLLDATNPTLLARDRVLDRLSDGMVSLDDGAVTAALLGRVAPIVATNPIAGQLESVVRLCWRDPAVALSIIEAAAEPATVIRLYARMLLKRPPFALFVALLERLSAASVGQQREMLAVTTAGELRDIAPTLAADIDAHPPRQRVAFLPAGFSLSPTGVLENSHRMVRT